MSIIQDALKKAANSTSINKTTIASDEKQYAVASGKIPAGACSADTPGDKKRISRFFIFAPLAVAVALAAAFLVLNSQLLAKNAQAVPKAPEPASTAASRQEVVKKSADNPLSPKSNPAQKPKTIQPPKFQLNGIMYIESGPKAIVNGSLVKEGDLISGAVVKKIGKQEVVLSYEDVEILLNMND